ncbi:CpaE family protein [Actinokineospora soli]|uniref:CpaE family protein n=1 Tax=Actinokineospora soli TaxID=1048753 RepID=A0ABW2TPE7_9PSEU
MAAHRPGPTAQVVTVLGATGGCGKTTVAATLAVVLAEAQPGEVCLVDLDADGDGVACAFGVRGDRGAGPAGPLALAPGLDGLLAAVAPGPRRSPEAVGELVALLSGQYRHVVVDTAQPLSATVLTALDYSSAHVVVAAAEARSARPLRRVLDVLDLLGFRPDQRSVVANRCDARASYSPDDLAAAARTDVVLRLPFDWAVAAAANRGHLLVDHPYRDAVRRFASARLVPPDLCGRDPPG